mmetsp:Transcript_18384/g.60623  ORF Transcript_18384/g.60623 Transcript_18384/m.60623 type:complete len:92 (-) Transcript_18384:49-324(-)
MHPCHAHPPEGGGQRRVHAREVSTASDYTHTLEALCGQTPIFLAEVRGRIDEASMQSDSAQKPPLLEGRSLLYDLRCERSFSAAAAKPVHK